MRLSAKKLAKRNVFRLSLPPANTQFVLCVSPTESPPKITHNSLTKRIELTRVPPWGITNTRAGLKECGDYCTLPEFCSTIRCFAYQTPKFNNFPPFVTPFPDVVAYCIRCLIRHRNGLGTGPELAASDRLIRPESGTVGAPQ